MQGHGIEILGTPCCKSEPVRLLSTDNNVFVEKRPTASTTLPRLADDIEPEWRDHAKPSRGDEQCPHSSKRA